LHALREVVEAHGPVRDELRVVEPLRDDRVEHRQSQGVVAAGPELKPERSLPGELGLPGIHHDQLRPGLQGVAKHEAELTVGSGVQRIVAPHQDAGGLNVAEVVTDRKVAEGHHAHVDPGQEALCGPRFAPVRRPDGVGKSRHEMEVMPPGTGAEGDALRAVGLLELDELRGDLVERAVPRDTLPLPRASLARAFQWILESIRVVDGLEAGGALGTESPGVQRRFGVPLDLDDLAVRDVDQHAAATVAHPAGALVHAHAPSRPPAA
jgi:hypothetical protein